MKSDVVLFGTGSLARAIVYNLATTMVSSTPLSVLIVGRSPVEVNEVAFVARGRAGTAGTGHAFLHQHRPMVTIVAASEQSPWELARDADPWAQLVKRGGFGVTLPLNASLVSQVFRVANGIEPRPFFINACYPDAVNSLLAAVGPSDRLVGVGNAAIIESLHRGAIPQTKTLRVVAHHRHLGELSNGRRPRSTGDLRRWQPRIAHRGCRCASRDTWYGVELGHWCVGLSSDSCAGYGSPFSGSVPGPLGEMGGYPVTVARGSITIDLPSEVSIADARNINALAALREGVMVRDGSAHFSAGARDALMEYGYPFADGFAGSNLPDAVSELRALQERLRRAPSK